ncbi:hypothetical protein [Persicirhabdus sediminis]|uniref:Uncharacterized protein n=1 Tax=Persicirhabdus sediminis TaxID=454144 RepID=A0A8J7MH56_9BACT|nr:hypothetical protein [Persicirhabdus sediminis]MBK1792743.1 hypothetical protein [Persicirhabdus sediminis]
MMMMRNRQPVQVQPVVSAKCWLTAASMMAVTCTSLPAEEIPAGGGPTPTQVDGEAIKEVYAEAEEFALIEAMRRKMAAEAEAKKSAASEAAEGGMGDDAQRRMDTSMSASRRFLLHGGDFASRTAISSLADDVHRKLIQLLRERDEQGKAVGGEQDQKIDSANIIDIRLHGKVGDPAPKRTLAKEINILDDSVQLLLHLHLARGVETEKLQQAVLEMLIYQRYLQSGQNVDLNERLLVWPWLSVGLMEAIRLNEPEADRRVYQALAEHMELFPPDKVMQLTQDEFASLNAVSYAAYRASAGALVSAMITQSGGREGMTEFLNDVAGYKGEVENLMREHFQGMNLSKESIQKFWEQQMLREGDARLTDQMSIDETEQKLSSYLKLRYRNEDGEVVTADLSHYKEVLDLDPIDRAYACYGVATDLDRLSYRCFDLYRRDIVANYQLMVQAIIAGKDPGIEAELERLQLLRMQMIAATQRVTQYLDWYQITNAEEVSGDFESYSKLLEEVARDEKMRDDAVSLYLDKAQRLIR